MAKEKILFPSKVDKKPTFMERIMEMLNRNSKLIDGNGKVSYIAYPLKKDFSKKQKEKAETLIINDVTIFGEDIDYRHQELKNAKKLVLGEGVLGVATGALHGTQFEEIELSEDVTMIPEGAITDSRVRRIHGPNFDISTDANNIKTDFYIDEDSRPHFIEIGRYSMGEESFKLSRGERMTEETRFASLALAKRMLFSTSKRDNEKSLYVYAPNLGSPVHFDVHGIMDVFPMQEDSFKRIPDEKLVGILVNGVDEVDLEDLKKYPNLMRVVIGKDVKRVIKAKDTEDSVVFDQDKKTVKLKEEGKQVYEQKNVNGFSQRILFASDTTEILTPNQAREDVVPERPLAKAAEKFAKKEIEAEAGPELE